MTQTETRQAEIALSRYLGYTVKLGGGYVPLWNMFDLSGKSCAPIGDEEDDIPNEERAWRHACNEGRGPKWSTDESLLSPLMKGLAEKGHTINVVNRRLVWCSYLAQTGARDGLTPIEAVFNIACEIPEVQQLLTA
jgi:hypothetical protein